MPQVKVEYDFHAQPNSGEMSVSAGDILTIVRENISGGWMEAKKISGETGLIPETYVTNLGQSLPPPPPLPTVSSSSSPTPFARPPIQDDWTAPSYASTNPVNVPSFTPSGGGAGASSIPMSSSLRPVSSSVPDDFDDEWTDEDEEQTEAGLSQGHGSLAGGELRGGISRSHSAGGERAAGGSRINRNINRFTVFVKSGLESYILSDSSINVPPSEKLEIVIAGNGAYSAMWRPIEQYYTCTVDKPKKESKFSGLKSFIAYSLTSSTSRIQVSRRYKHFDWLHEQLSSKFVMIPIPPLPEKQVAGRYEEDLIDHRKHILQLWVNKICRHPVISRSEVWLHFMTCTDEKQWKIGKRKAEKDELVGGNFFHSVQFPTQPLQVHEVERHVEVFQRSVRSMDDSVRVMSERLAVFQKLFNGPVKQNWQKMAAAFSSLGQSFEADNNPGSTKMVDALKHTAVQYHSIGEEFEKHTKDDMEPMLETLYSYKGTVQAVPDILNIHKQAIGKQRETERACSEGKLSQSDAERIKRRVDNTSYMLLAEINQLNQEKVEDFRSTIGSYLKNQADFYQKMANSLNELAQHY